MPYKSLIVEKKVAHFTAPKKSNTLDLNQNFPQAKLSKTSEKIDLSKNSLSIDLDNAKFQFKDKNLSFDISEKDIQFVMGDIIRLFNDPVRIAVFLFKFDKTLGEVMKKNGVDLSGNPLPKYLIEGPNYYLPGPPPLSYLPLRKGRMLDNLLKNENENKNNNNNKQGSTHKLVGKISHEKVAKELSEGRFFGHVQQISRSVLKGSYPHRLILKVLRAAIKSEEVDLKLQNGILTFDQLLELLVKVTYGDSGKSLWELVFDGVSNPSIHHLNYGLPTAFNSLILCFGQDLGLPNLQHYLLDNFYKEMYKMVFRAKKEARKISTINVEKLSDEQFYINCLNLLLTPSSPENNTEEKIGFFTHDKKYLMKKKQYEIVDEEGIVKRKDSSKDHLGAYKGWPDFFKKHFKGPKHSSDVLIPSNKSDSKKKTCIIS